MVENGFQFNVEFYATHCKELIIKAITTTKYHAHGNKQFERFNAIMISRLRHPQTEPEKNWEAILIHAMYMYNVQVYWDTKLIPFSLVSTRPPLLHVHVAQLMSPNVCQVDAFLTYRLCVIRRTVLWRKMVKNLYEGRREIKKDYDTHIKFWSYLLAKYMFSLNILRLWHLLRSKRPVNNTESSHAIAQDSTRLLSFDYRMRRSTKML